MSVNLNSNFSSPSSSSSVQEFSAPLDGISSLKNTFSNSTLTNPPSSPAEKLSCWTRFCNFLRDLFRKIFCCCSKIVTTTDSKKQQEEYVKSLNEKANQINDAEQASSSSLPLSPQINPIVPLSPSKGEEEKAPQKPFPYLLDLAPSKDNPLSKELPRDSFLALETQTEVAKLKQLYSSQGKNLNLIDAVIMGRFPNSRDDALLSVPLWYFLHPNDPGFSDFGRDRYGRILAVSEREVAKQLIQQRIQDLNQEIQFEERMERLGLDAIGSSFLQIRHLLPSWTMSPLKYFLMMDDELCRLRVSSLALIGGRLFGEEVDSCLEVMASRLEVLVSQNHTLVVISRENFFETALLTDLAKLTGEQVNQHIAKIPLITLQLIAPKELPNVDMTNFTKEQVECLFGSKRRLRALSSGQVNRCISKVQNKKLFSGLSEKQIMEFDWTQADQVIFDVIYPSHSSHAMDCLQRLSLDKIYELSAFFSKKHWEELRPRLTQEQREALDLTQIRGSLTAQAVFDVLYHPYSSHAMGSLPKLSLNKIYELSAFFSKKHWEELRPRLTQEQREALDLTKVQGSFTAQMVFDILYSPSLPSAMGRFRALPINKMRELYNFFLEEHWKTLGGHLTSPDKTALIQDLDFSTVRSPLSKEAVLKALKMHTQT